MGDLAAVKRNIESESVDGDESVAGGLVHVALIGVVGGGWGIMGRGGVRRGGVKVCEGDYVVLLSEAVKKGEKGIFAARYEGYDFVRRRCEHCFCLKRR